MKKISLILMGCGGVGRHLLQHIVSCRSLHAKLGVHLRVVGVCDSKSIVLTSNVQGEELNDSLISEICNVKSSGSSLSKLSSVGGCQVFQDSESKMKVIDVASILGNSTGLALVDCSASSETINLLKQGVDLGCSIVLANKKPLTSTMEDYEKLVSFPRYIRHESTVGAGLPVIASLNRIISSGDPVQRIIGSLSGTLGYVMSEVEGGKPLSQVVRLAKSLGYTEPDPRDDLSGMDVGRKALILARLLGRHLNFESIKPRNIIQSEAQHFSSSLNEKRAIQVAEIPKMEMKLSRRTVSEIESLYPQEMGPDVISVDDFLSSALLKLDENIKERVKTALANGNVLRYVCLLEGSRCEVGLKELPKNSPLGRLRGSDNVLEVYTRCYSEQPLVIQGAGAGNNTTAAGVLADILDLQDLFPSVTY